MCTDTSLQRTRNNLIQPPIILERSTIIQCQGPTELIQVAHMGMLPVCISLLNETVKL